jgi:hypothetical protein
VQTDPDRPADHPAGPLNGPVADPAWEAEDVSLEELVLGYMGQTPGRRSRS